MRDSRIRWAAIGAAIAVSIGGGGIGITHAALSSGSRNVFVPIAPCRIMDTRPTTQVGPKSSPIGPNETYTVSTFGDNGQCTGIPSDAAALSLNVTALDASAPTFLTFWPADQTQPHASSLNPLPGAGPTPNAVTTDLAADGRISIFNKQGTVDVLVDVNGYFVDHDHDDRYYTKAQLDDRTAGDVIAMGFVNALGATPVVQEQRTAAGVSVAVTNLSAGRVDVVVTGADTADAPMIAVTAHSIIAVPRTCNTRSLSVGPGPTTWTARIECYDAAGAAAANTSFTFIVVD
jgi:hypothetical protein